MRFVNGILAAALALVCSAPVALAQPAAAATQASAEAARPASKTYRLVWTLTDVDNGKPVGTQHFAMVVLSGGKTTMKLSSKVPIATGSYGGNSTGAGVQTQFQYVDVSLNIYASLEETATDLKLSSTLDQSGVAEEKSNGTLHEPVIRNASLTSAAIMTLGKPVMLGSLDVPGSTRHLDVEVVLENVK